MQNRSKKLPYVFIEIDESEAPDFVTPYMYSGGIQPYRPDYPSAPMMPYPQVPVMPQANMQPQPMIAPYPAPAQGYMAQPSYDPRFQGRPWRERTPYEEDEELDDRIDEEPEDVDIDIRKEDIKGYEDIDAIDYQEDDDDFDIELSGEDLAPVEDDVVVRQATTYPNRMPEEGHLDLRTVVIPVFKNMDNPAPDRPAQAFPSPSIGPQLVQPLPFFQTLPFAYNPYRIPFVNPLWAQSQMMPFGGAPLQPRPMPNVQSGHHQAASNQRAASNANHLQNSRPNERPNGMQSAHQGPNSRTDGQSDALKLPAEAREALYSDKSSRAAARSSQNVSKLASELPETISSNALRTAANASDSIGGAPDPAKTQTITASNDSVSVSVSVLPSRAQVQSVPQSGGAGQVDTSSLQAQVKRNMSQDSNRQPVPASSQVPAQNNDMPPQSVPVSKGSKAKRKADGRPQKETFEEKAMRENAEKTHTSLLETNDAAQMGKPLLDASAIENSEMFSKPADSMDESLSGFKWRSSRRKHVLVIAFVAVVLALVVAAVVCVFAIWTGAATISFDDSNFPSIQLAESSQPQES